MKHHYVLPDISRSGKSGCTLPDIDVNRTDIPPEKLLRRELLLPEVSEVELVRYFTALSKLNYCVDSGFYPLGSCTMKYNPKWHEDVGALPGFCAVHPYQSVETVQGALKLMYELQKYLSEITGMVATSLVPMAGAQGEFANLLMVKAYHLSKGNIQRRKILVPDSAHGTNPATAAMCDFEISTVPSDSSGDIDLSHLKELLDDNVAALTMTIPSTLGLFDRNVVEISKMVHERGALLVGDGANLNSIIGKVKLGDLGIDCVQLNLHKTFSTPHGGGGPGAGPVSVGPLLADFLPTPLIVVTKNGYDFVTPKNTVGSLGAAYGNFGVMVKAYAYIRSLGSEGLRAVSEDAVLNANYMKEKLKPYFHLPYDRTCMHEVIFGGKRQKAKGVHTMDIAKRLLDYGFHPPTVYFPLIVDEALMIEPTETENKATLDAFADAMIQIARETDENPEVLHTAPHTTPVRRLDDVTASRKPDLRWTMTDNGEKD